MKIKEITRRLIVDILYAALEDGDVGFLKNAYDELKLHDNKRIRKMRKNWNKISSKAVNTVYEDIIGIIVEEICQKANRGLLDDLMGYYLKRFPDVQERIDDFGDDIEGLLDHQTSIYPFVQERDEEDETDAWHLVSVSYDNFPESGSDYIDFLKRSLILLYGITVCEKNKSKVYIRKFQDQMYEHYKDMRFMFYDRQQIIGNMINWLKNVEEEEDFDLAAEAFVAEMRKKIQEVYEIAPEKVEEFILEQILCRDDELYACGNTLYNLKPIEIGETLGNICKKFHMNSLEIYDDDNRLLYIDTIRGIFENWCKNKLASLMLEQESDSFMKFDGRDVVRCVSEVAAAFLFQCYVESQQGIWDEYYQNFSFYNRAEAMEELYEKCSHLNDENIQYRKKIRSYKEADSLRRKQQKESDRQYTEKIALLEKQIGEQVMLQENMGEYIRLVEAAGDDAIKVEEADYVKIYNHKIAFVGGEPETVSKLKAVFRTAAFIKNENMPVPEKADLIVLLAGNTDHALYYKYIGVAREKTIKVIYCNKTEIESVTAQVCNSL